jgi:DNA-binding NtrC family response regulator
MPALRQRRDDIPLLVDHFLKRHARGGTPKLVSKEGMELLMKYDWPGNVRELENVMERALILDEGGVIGFEDLPDKIRFGHSQKGSLIIDSPNMTLEELEKEYILKVLNYTRWQKKRSSELLGINASTLYRKLISYGIEKPGGDHDGHEGEEHGSGSDERAA